VPGKFEMSVGKGFAVAVDDSGKVYAWGANEVGQLGKKTDEALGNQAVEVGKLPAAPAALVSGYEHTCALAKGTVWCFGSNRYGQVNGTVSDTPLGVVEGGREDGGQGCNFGVVRMGKTAHRLYQFAAISFPTVAQLPNVLIVGGKFPTAQSPQRNVVS